MAKDPHAVALGQKGGKAKSEAKTRAARANGVKGGRPSMMHECAAHVWRREQSYTPVKAN
jgi:hypothetical protein